jgi:hypothetical protein
LCLPSIPAALTYAFEMKLKSFSLSIGAGNVHLMLHSFIHVTPVAEAHLSNASPFQTPLITPNNKLIKPTNKDNFLPG